MPVWVSWISRQLLKKARLSNFFFFYLKLTWYIDITDNITPYRCLTSLNVNVWHDTHVTNNKADVILKDAAYLHACVCKVELAGYLLARECCFSRLLLCLSGSSAAPGTTSISICSPPSSWEPAPFSLRTLCCLLMRTWTTALSPRWDG